MGSLDLSVKIYADGADFENIKSLISNPLVEGFTTNPTLMRRAGVEDYEKFAHEVLDIITDKPVSFEVFADDLPTMEKQARVISSWGNNVIVKVPVLNTKGTFTGPIIERLSNDGVKLNVTAIMSLEQVARVANVLSSDTSSIVSVFAGRIADTGRDPIIIMKEALNIISPLPKAELLWASPRETYNVYQADEIGCHIITVTQGLMNKLNLFEKDLNEFSLETVAMFYKDAQASNYTIRI